MKNFNLDRVILVLSDNPEYGGFWEYSSKFWKNKFGVKPTLFFYGTPQKISIDASCGDVFFLNKVPEVTVNEKRDWACTWGLFYGAAQFEDDVCMTCGIDQAPLSDSFFKTVSKYDYDKDYVVGLADAHRSADWFISSHHIAKGKMFRQVYGILPSWEEEVKKVFSFRNSYGDMYGLYHGMVDYWGLDEKHSSFIIKNNPVVIKHRGVYHEYIYPNRLDRGYNMDVDVERLRSGGYSELHAPRPYNDHKEILDLIYSNTPCFV
jgi:hypothetical protein